MRNKLFALLSLLVVLSTVMALAAQCPPPAAPTTAPPAPTTAPPAPTKAPPAPTTAPPAPTTAPPATVPAQLPRNETLYIAGLQWQAPQNFNPLNGNPDWPGMGNHLLTYETLFAYNQLTGNLDPLLAKELKVVDATTMQITLQDGTKWQDGKPLTTDDVIYTYNLAKSQADINYSTLFSYISEIKATGDRTLQVTLNPQLINPGMVKNFFTQIKILPKNIWQAREASGKLSQFVDTSPVGSGPYKLLNYSPERIALVRDDSYWGKPVFGLPVPKYVVHPIFKTNDVGNLAFQNGEVDLMQQFTPQIWKMWEDAKAPVGTWFNKEPYYIPGSIPMLVINVHKKGLDNPLVRRALAYSINYPLIAQTAMSKYSVPANSSLILPTGGESSLFNADAVKANGWSYDPAKAKDILENQLKAKKGADGIYVLPDGTRLGPWSARTPNGWTDWQTAINIVVQSAKAAGIELKEDYPDAPVVTSKIQNGDFDLNLWYITGSGAASPWQRFRDMLDSRGVADFGKTTFWNYGRFSDPAVAALLDKAGQASDPAAVKAVYDQLDKIFMDNVVGIPLMYRPQEFYEFNQKYWTGFPTSDNPTAPPMFSGAGVEVLYKIKAK
jgi:peptide/nickel transport system substrate-binding protein